MPRLLWTLVRLLKSSNRSAAERPRNLRLGTLGSEHGNKTYVELSDISFGLVVCAGAGEDISFDIELAIKEKSNIVIVDPTLRAVKHFREVSKRFGLPSEASYSTSGVQPIESYDLQTLSSKSVQFIQKALWEKSTIVDFFSPKDPLHVSHSIVNLQGSDADLTPQKVETITLKEVLKMSDFHFVSLLKLDIEGAAYAVCRNAFKEGVFPRQIIVEFDELIHPTWQGLIRVLKLRLLLKEFKYVAVHSDGLESTFLRQMK